MRRATPRVPVRSPAITAETAGPWPEPQAVLPLVETRAKPAGSAVTALQNALCAMLRARALKESFWV